VLSRELFHEIGGYDTGMLLPGVGAAEFSVRAWLSGVQVYSEPQLEVTHLYNTGRASAALTESHQHYLIHNSLRFASLYLDEDDRAGAFAYYSQHFPRSFDAAQVMLEEHELAERRTWLEQGRLRTFDWFAGYFDIDRRQSRELSR
jgi:hypothetical protein